MSNWTTVLFVLLASSCVCFALYEDETNVKDWYYDNVGNVVKGIFYPTPSRKHIYVQTESNVIAALSMKTGETVWKQILNEPVDLLVHKGNNLLAISGGTKFVRLFDGQDGGLVWEHYLQLDNIDASTVDAALVDTENDGTDEVVLLLANTLQYRNIRDGKVRSTISLSNDNKHARLHTRNTNNNSPTELLVVSLNSALTQLAVAQVDLEKFELIPAKFSEISDKSAKFQGKSLVATANYVAVLDSNNNIHLHGITAGNLQTSTPLKSVLPSGVEAASDVSLIQAGTNQDYLLVSLGKSGSVVLKIGQDSKLQLLHHFAAGSRISWDETGGVGYVVGVRVGPTTTTASATNKVQLVSLETGKIEEVDLPADLAQDRGNLVKVFLNVFSRKDGQSKSHRLLITFEDQSLHLVQDGTLQWKREEGLSSISHVEVIDLPSTSVLHESFHTLEQEEKGEQGVVASFLTRLKAQSLQVQELFQDLLGNPVQDNDTASLASAAAEKHVDMVKDSFGFRKLIIATTTSGNVFGIHTERGAIVWKRFFPDCHALDVYVIRTVAHYPPVAAIVCHVKQETLVNWVNPLTGLDTHDPASHSPATQSHSSTLFSYTTLQGIVLPHVEDSHGNHLLLLIDTQLRVHLFPETQHAQSVFTNRSDSIFFYVVDKQENTIKGYAVSQQASPFSFESSLMWTKSFVGGTEEVIVDIAHTQENWAENVNSPTRILGNRNALGKYINKNMLSVATVRKTPSSIKTVANQLDTAVNVYLLDAVTGRTLYHTYQLNTVGPVHICHAENSVIFQYFNSKQHRHEVTVLELYEPELDWNGTPFSSFNTTAPNVRSQSYVLNSGLQFLATTNTARGITNRFILLALDSGQILGVNKAFFDPRRVSKEAMSNEDKEEGLYPYDPTLPLNPKSYLTYYKKVHNLRAISTSPATLESTSLVVAYGLEVFFSRVAPSSTFDVLNPDFNYFALILCTVTLIVLTSVTSWMSEKKDLNRLWK